MPDQVFARLCDLIITGHYEPGERLPTQRALASDFGVNMASVREAIKRLEQLRLVEVRHGDATRVLDWHRAGLEALALLGTVDSKILRPLYEARRLILTQVASLAAERRTDAQSEELVDLARAVANAEDDREAQIADWAFIAAIVAAADNLIFELMANSVREMYMAHSERFVLLITGRDELGPLYHAVAAAIAAGNPSEAQAATAQLTNAQAARMIEAV